MLFMHISSPARPVVPETAAPCVHVPTFFTYGKTRPRMCLNMMNLGWQLRMSRYEDYIGVFYTVMFHDSGTGVILVRIFKKLFKQLYLSREYFEEMASIHQFKETRL